MIKLCKVNEAEFKRYMDFMIPDYAQDITKNFDLPMEQALEESEMMMNDMFKDGLATEGQYLYNIVDANSNEKVGLLWYSIISEINQAYLYHILIDEAKRGLGYGSKTLEKLQEILKNSGVKSIGLSVFGKNDGAYRLYKKLGYSNTRISMEKIL
ncbi:GNAT family N-acetyltransferase [Fictibacillus sp. b24]|uniref:GNAT family N-acetyltransferase n=1 Tax=Fictibacillus sp. b24 TaxID=3055863 RepID=UPI0025A24628|nr:GNAT family N-acetyltransferase [Fictibacillus sp. b24]MDM5317257.1 GNAT family N-acetyltransferase [Fictibacillus sp. b24]